MAACAPSDPEFGIQLEALSIDPVRDTLQVRARQRIDLSREARKALRAGVPLRFRLDVALKREGQWRAGSRERFVYELRYLPLSQRYQLSGPDAETPPTSYPRLRHALAAMQAIDLSLDAPVETGRPMTLRMRSRLDQAALPGPMQLPVMLSADWQHDSGWLSHEFSPGG
ncbi:MAG: DUF4390 domain-containing protein [Xanthomonadales bacterium]|nr:DUF4390 domain-containing protein [Xanthomonadales bacterium]